MVYEQLENDIIARLTPGFPGVDVLALPETQADFNKPIKRGRVTVVYKGGGFGPVKSTGTISQLETPEFELMVQGKLLRGAGGVYDFIARIKSLLLGYRLTGTDRVFLKDIALVINQEANVDFFTFAVSVACTMLITEDREETEV